MINFLENDIKHLEREIADCNTRYNQLVQQRDELAQQSRTDEQAQEQQQWISEKISQLID